MTKSLAARAAAALDPLIQRFQGQTALIFASGPSLTELWHADRPIPFPSIAVNDAWQIVPPRRSSTRPTRSGGCITKGCRSSLA